MEIFPKNLSQLLVTILEIGEQWGQSKGLVNVVRNLLRSTVLTVVRYIQSLHRAQDPEVLEGLVLVLTSKRPGKEAKSLANCNFLRNIYQKLLVEILEMAEEWEETEMRKRPSSGEKEKSPAKSIIYSERK